MLNIKITLINYGRKDYFENTKKKIYPKEKFIYLVIKMYNQRQTARNFGGIYSFTNNYLRYKISSEDIAQFCLYYSCKLPNQTLFCY